ncbi:MAG: amino acid ABC transporter permease [Alphaproteobacteria bacterium]|nr:amino acid ABC transporter permease [Alphaproteobacteria bacterium]
MAKKSDYKGFVRTEIAPLMPPPPSEAGVTGWLYKNIFASMSDFNSVGGSIKSVLMAVLTILLGYVFFTQIYTLLDFAIFSAVWTGQEGVKREVCLTVDQGGDLPSGWHGACWPFIYAKFKFIIYGPYDNDQLWRVNLAGLIGLIGMVWVMIEKMPYRRHVGIFLVTVYPVLALILLSGGNFNTDYNDVAINTLIGLVLITIGRQAAAGRLGKTAFEFATMFGISGWIVIAYAAVIAVLGMDVGLKEIGTNDWGGLLITLVVAITGIVASLPLGIVLALGRRSQMPVARILSTVFIEFWRGVPLITVLFMASVMLPLFLPEGVNFDNLLRALIGVMLFSAAYMAEVVRGGLQAMDKGQFEGADALGLSYWQKMRLIILPQALTHVIPGIVNTFIGLFKDTTLVSIVSIFDMLGATQSTYSDAAWAMPGQDETGYLFICIIYFVFCFGMSRYSMFMEYKLSTSRKN